MNLRVLLLLIVLLSFSNSIHSQLFLLESGIYYTIDFEESMEGVNESSFQGMGLRPFPQSGELDSDAWEIIGCSDGPSYFSDISLSGDFSRGFSPGNESLGGIYCFESTSLNHSLGWQSTGSDLSPGSLCLKIQNLSSFSIERISLRFRLNYLNDQNRSQKLCLSYSKNNIDFSSNIACLISPELADSPADWQDSLFVLSIDSLAILSGEYLYLKWLIEDESGSGSRDEWALDDIGVQISNNTCLNEVFALEDSSNALLSTSGFVLNGIDSYYTSPSNYGQHSPSARMDDHLDALTSPIVSNAFSLKFWFKGQGNTDGSSLIIEGFDGLSWIQIDNLLPLPSSGAIHTLNNLSSYSQFRFTYLKQNGNLAIDDIQVSCGSCELSDPVSESLNEINIVNVSCNQAEITWPGIDAEYYLVLATQKSSIVTSAVDHHSYSSDNNYVEGEIFEDSVFVVHNGSSTIFNLQHLESGADYLIEVIPYNGLSCEENYSSASLSETFSTADCNLCPSLEWALVNPCNELCGNDEGKNEMLLFNSGEYSLSPDTSEMKIYVEDGILNQNMLPCPSIISYLNTSCSGLFIDGSQEAMIPTNSKILICRNDVCLDELPLDLLCSYPVIYLIACQSDEWNDFGMLKNQGYLAQNIRLDISGVEENCVVDYQYVPDNLPHQNGALALFDQGGGSMIDYELIDECSGSSALPLEWGALEVKKQGEKIKISWTTYSEFQNSGFEIERSYNGVQFETIAWIDSQGSSAFNLNYIYYDSTFANNQLFYRIKQIDYNGNFSYSQTELIVFRNSVVICIENKQLKIKGLNELNHLLRIYTVDGLELFRKTLSSENEFVLNLSPFVFGVYLLKLENEFESKVLKFVH